ncbi:hypothetical protein KCG43_10065 [Photobacterium sp. WH24]|uniref:hypothetical protein n=1 Tax=Photobacterium sp. WH24 TaxID=2827237 RepID=UPI001C438740|nr:hypothetical protein [Photobacterium sp. WH24]MBV7262335.1 hypothetical protein [Photobacterium sp. WH24]
MNLKKINDPYFKDEISSFIKVMQGWKNGKDINPDEVMFIKMRMELLQKQLENKPSVNS